MTEKLYLTTCLQDAYGFTGREVNQGYYKNHSFRHIDWDSPIKLLPANVLLEYMKVSSNQNIRYLHLCLQDRDPDNTDLVKFDDDLIETQCKALLSDKVDPDQSGSSDKSHYKPEVWEGDILKLGVWMRKSYVWLGTKKNTRGVPITWLLIILDATLDSDGNPIEGN